MIDSFDRRLDYGYRAAHSRFCRFEDVLLRLSGLAGVGSHHELAVLTGIVLTRLGPQVVRPMRNVVPAWGVPVAGITRRGLPASVTMPVVAAPRPARERGYERGTCTRH